MRKRRSCPTAGILPTRIRDNIEELLHIGNEGGDDECLKMLKAIHRLSDEDKKLLCYYAELRSFRKMQVVLGASATTWRREIIRIRRTILEQL